MLHLYFHCGHCGSVTYYPEDVPVDVEKIFLLESLFTFSIDHKYYSYLGITDHTWLVVVDDVKRNCIKNDTTYQTHM